MTGPEAKQRARQGAGRPSAKEAERKKLALLDAASSEFAAHGFNGASLRTIAEKACVSTRTLFNHYPDKFALFAACIHHSSQSIGTVASIRRASLEETLIAYATQMQDRLSTPVSRQLAMLIYREGAVFEEIRKVAREQFETYQVAPVSAILQDFGYDEAVAREFAVQFVAMAFGQWQRWMLFGTEPITPAEVERHLRVVTGIFLLGIGQPRQSAQDMAGSA